MSIALQNAVILLNGKAWRDHVGSTTGNDEISMKKISLLILLVLGLSHAARAQHISLSTNFVDWANFGTANIEAGISVSQHFSFTAGGHYNPWEFKTAKGAMMYNKQMTGYAGVRYWPWYVFSGWWIEAKAQYSSFGRTGIWRPALEKGESVGGGLSFGYTIMLNKNLNLEFGAGIWGGRHLKYTIYECPVCMRVRETGPRNFIYPDDVSISIMYLF